MKQTNKEYAEALFSLAQESNSVKEYSFHLQELYSLINENKGYTEYLSSPAMALSERLAAIDEAFADRMPEYIVSFVKLLCENGRITELGESIEEFFRLEMLASNLVNVTVYSSIPLDDAQKEKLCKKLEAKHKKAVKATYVEDKDLIGGIKIVMEDKVMDGSIRRQLKEVIKQ